MELRVFGIKLATTLIATPIMGWVIMKCAEGFEKYWKTNNRRKKWLVSCGLFLLLAAIGGWLQ
jgi:hypothetical protein